MNTFDVVHNQHDMKVEDIDEHLTQLEMMPESNLDQYYLGMLKKQQSNMYEKFNVQALVNQLQEEPSPFINSKIKREDK